MEIYQCKVNHLENPLGFKLNRTVFSWKVKNTVGKMQNSARIQIYANTEETTLLWDTGFEKAASSIGFSVQMELTPRTRYYWRVTVKTDAQEEITSEKQWFETGKREESWAGKWISCDSKEKRHPFFEKSILPAKRVQTARLYICGLGLYEAYYNGVRIGEEYLTPYSNDYFQWVQYQTFDVTELMQKEGVLSVLLGNGWYKARFGFNALADKGFYGDSWKLIAELRLTYEDGTKEVIGTDESWTVRRSNITFSNLYDGEKRDDTLAELPLENAVYTKAPGGELQERLSLPVTIHEQFTPMELIRSPKGEMVLDMGQEFSGIFSLRVHEPRGTKIRIQTGEVLQDGCFYNDNLRSAKSEYEYISDGEEKIIVPHFTYYGYRYVKIEGVTNLQKKDFVGLALYSDIGQIGVIRTGHSLVNQLFSNVVWGLKGNFLDVPTDCPQRDERMGWTGDAQVFSGTASFLTESYAFYNKYLYDMWQEQKALGGKVPDVVPSCGIETTSTVWGDAACIIPWNLYCFYGDSSILKDQYDSMKAWVDYIKMIDGENHGWREKFHYGDWLALDNPAGGVDQVLGGTDEGFIAYVYYAVSASILAKAAQILGLEQDAVIYEKLSQEQFAFVKREYFSVTGKCCVNTQTALLLTLKYELSENVELTKKMLRKLFTDNQDRLQTGFVGTPLMCNVLSEWGFSELAYDLLLNEDAPGWLHEILLGATTVWERWNSIDDDGHISSTGMNSMNHYSYGTIVEWLFRHCIGLEPKEECPGFKEVTIRPEFSWELGSASAVYDSAAGCYEIEWKMTEPDYIELSVTIPFGCGAELSLPGAPKELFVDKSNPIFADVKADICHLGAGQYHVGYRTRYNYQKEYSIDTPIGVLFRNQQATKKLAGIVNYTDIAVQYRSYSLREIYERFDSCLTKEIIDRAKKALGGK